MRKCNICNKDFDLFDEQANFCMDKIIPYGSEHDGDRICLNLCCECFDKVMADILPKCRVNPITEV